MKKTILFIHGMFQNPKSWAKWQSFFEANGYETIAPAWPLHEGEPSDLRNNIPAGLGDLRLQTIVDHYANIIQGLAEKPIVIGHSVGGLIVQLLTKKQLIKAGVCISSVAPNRMLAFDWGFFKNSITIANPFAGDEPFIMTPEAFHGSFANTMAETASNVAYGEFATHDSRNVLRDCMLEAGEVDLDIPHVPLLFVAAQEDQICPAELNEKNANSYKDEGSKTDYQMFPARSHYICGEPGWEEVANNVQQWINTNA
ncbi:MAG TPA: alpha/beta hydrolase [Daejeonella sp.]